MVQPWFELESDPGLFTLLVEDFGIGGVQVEEIYDLDTVTEMSSEALGFIFLFRWIEDRRRRRKLLNENNLSVKDPKILQDMFFAHQVIPNSCATHALLSILLNSEGENVKLTKELLRLKTSTRGLTPEQKGDAIGSLPKIAEAHNSHASPHLRLQQENKSSTTGASQTGEAYHYVSYLPVNGHLYEMDGLKPWPLDHGEVGQEDWTQKFSDVITERLGGGDIMFNLMAVVPDKRLAWRDKLANLQANWNGIEKNIKSILKTWKDSIPDPLLSIIPTNGALTVKEWMDLVATEHNYTLPVTKPDSPIKSPVKTTNDDESMSAQVESLLNTLSQVEEDNSTEVVVFQTDPDTEQKVELQELSDFDPFLSTSIEALDVGCDSKSSNALSVQELLEMLTDMKSHITDAEQQLKEQEDLRDKYKIDVCRRTHNYYPFITTFLRMIAERGLLTDMVTQLTQPKKKAAILPTYSNNNKSKKRQIIEKKKNSKTKKKN